MARYVLTEADISQQAFERFKRFLEDSCGVILGGNKRYLVINRLERILDQYAIKTFEDLLDQICTDRNRPLRLAVIDAMTTHETFWFRDSHPFHFLGEVLKQIARQSSGSTKEVRIWSAACSTGQEPYSLAMVIDQLIQSRALSGLRVSIVATDVSDIVISQAKTGVYPNLAVGRGLNNDFIQKYFSEDRDGNWVIAPRIKQYVTFKTFNLIDSFDTLGTFDIVFIRNVLIYFSKEMKSRILEQISQVLRPEGYLFLGASESLRMQRELFIMERYPPQGIMYRKKT